jgi:hypothetical protein
MAINVINAQDVTIRKFLTKNTISTQLNKNNNIGILLLDTNMPVTCNNIIRKSKKYFNFLKKCKRYYKWLRTRRNYYLVHLPIVDVTCYLFE